MHGLIFGIALCSALLYCSSRRVLVEGDAFMMGITRKAICVSCSVLASVLTEGSLVTFKY